MLKPRDERKDIEAITLNGLYDVLVEFEEEVGDLNVGLVNNAIGSGDYTYPDMGRMCFYVERDIVLKRVHVYADCPGDLTISLVDATGNVLHNPVTIFIEQAHVKTAITLDYFLYPPLGEEGAMFYLIAESQTVKLFRTRDADFPYDVPDLIRIDADMRKGSNQRDYFFFYDWHLAIPDPESGMYQKTYPARCYVGLEDNRVGTGSYQDVEGKGILFDVEKPVIIEEVFVYGDQAGTIEVAILDERGIPVEGWMPVEIRQAYTRTRVVLNCKLDECQGYKMAARSNRVSLFASEKEYARNDNEAFPYKAGDSIVLIGGEHNGRLQHTYFFFYDWKIVYPKELGTDFPGQWISKEEVLATIQEEILSCRNVGEDLVCIKELLPEEVGICADIEVDPTADLEAILAEIFFMMEEYVKPSCKVLYPGRITRQRA